MTRLLRAGFSGLFSCLISLGLCATASAQTPVSCPEPAQPATAEQAEAAARDARDHGFLWRISQGGRTSWLYGTIHVGRLAWTFPGPRVDAALRASDTIALEIDNLDPEMQRRVLKGFAEPTGTPYPHVSSLPYELRERLQRLAAAQCFQPELLELLPPYFATAVLTSLTAQQDGLYPAHGVDNALSVRGHREQRTVVSLETPEVQLKAMKVPGTPAATLEAITSLLDEIESDRARPLMLRVAQLWADGDWRTFADYASWCDCVKTAADRADMKRMLDDRNPGLAASIDALHAAGKSVFAAVGSLHMIGPTGLPALLAKRGYRVERIDYNRPEETRP